MVSCMDGTDRSSIQTHCAGAAGAARERARVEPARDQCHPVCRRAWLHVAGLTGSVRAVAYHLHTDESLVKERGPQPGVRTPPEGPTRPDQAGGGVAGQHHREGSPRRDRCAKQNGPQALGKSRGGWTTKIHRVAAEARTAVTVSLSPGQTHDAPEGRKLLHRLRAHRQLPLLMDRAYEGNETRQLARLLGFAPVGPPRKSRLDPWEYDRELYKRRNEVERLFRRLKGFRRIFSRFEKLDVIFLGFIVFALIFDALR